MTFGELIARIKQVAMDIADESMKPKLAESEALIELILPRCLAVIITDILETSEGINSFREETELTFVNGEANLPDGLKEEHIELITFLNDSGVSYIPDYFVFQNDITTALIATTPHTVGRFTYYNGKIIYYPKGAAQGAFSGTVDVLATVMPVLPSTTAGTVNLREDILQRLINFTVGILIGKIPFNIIGMTGYEEEDDN